jgi:hypothetical protein
MAMNLQTVMPAAVTTYSQKIVADVDGDGFNEVILFDTYLQQLSIVHQFKYSDFTLNGINSSVWPSTDPQNMEPVWPNDVTVRWMAVWSAQQGAVPAAAGVSAGGWVIGSDDGIMAADLDGDGQDELFIYNLTTSWWGVLEWQAQTGELQTVCKVQGPGNRLVPLGQLVWTASQGDEYCLIPNISGILPSANGVGILAYNSRTVNLGMIYYEDGTFLQPWYFNLLSLDKVNGSGGWTLNQKDVFYAGNFARQGTPSVVVRNPPDGYMDLLQWTGSDFPAPPAQGHNAGAWNFGSADQLQCADLDGDGIWEILIYNAGATTAPQIGVLKWNAGEGQFDCLAIGGQIGSGANVWNVGKSDQYFCVNGSGGHPGQIYSYSPASSTFAVLSYQSGSFACQWAGQSLLPNNGWPVGAGDSYCAGVPWNSASPELFTISNQGASQLLTLGAVTWNGAEPAVALSAALPIQAWSPAMLATAPATSFDTVLPLDANQQAIYVQISHMFPDPKQPYVPGSDNVRHYYKNANDTGKFESYSDAIMGLITQSSPEGFIAVVTEIAAECDAVDTAYSMSKAIGKLGNELHKLQMIDFTTVQNNIAKLTVQPPESAVVYWFEQIGVAAIWGLAAAGGVLFPEAAGAAAAFGITMSVVASGAGSIFDYNPGQPKSYGFETVRDEISSMFTKSWFARPVELEDYLKDPVKLKILNGLSQTVWKTRVDLPDSSKARFQAMDRVWLYQSLLPFYCSIAINAAGRYAPPPVFALNGNYYAICVGGRWLDPSDFTGSDLYADLFTTLGVSQADFFTGLGNWAAIPRHGVPNTQVTAAAAD